MCGRGISEFCKLGVLGQLFQVELAEGGFSDGVGGFELFSWVSGPMLAVSWFVTVFFLG